MKMALVAAAAAGSALAAAQAPVPPPANTVFEVASIKQNRNGGPVAGMRRLPGGRFEVTNIQLSTLISFAYQLQPYELTGEPSWLMDERWDILAKIDGDPPAAPPGTADANAMATRALLADRFKLVLRRETREVPVYQLVRANRDGRLGNGMRPSTVDCLTIQRAADDAAKGGPPAPSPNTPDRLVCGLRISVGRIQMGGRPLSPPGIELPPPDPDKASLFTVLQEQLGLRLEAARLPMPVMVVDRVERPVED